MIRAAILAAAVVLAAAAPALAQVTGAPTPTLRAAVTVDSDLVRIGDLVDNAGAVAAVPIFRSPDIGTTGAVPVAQVLDALRPHSLLLVDTRALTEIEVTRAGHTIAGRDIEARIARVFAGRQGLGEEKNLTVKLDREIRPIRLDVAVGELAINRAHYDRRAGRFDVTFEVPRMRTLLRYTGSLVETTEVGVLVRAVERGEILRASDVAIERRPTSDVTLDAVASAAQVVGLASRQALPAGRMLRHADLLKPDLVKRDEPVTLVFEVPGMTLTMRGKALEAGTDGDLVDVLNVQSKRTVQGQVSGPGRVTVASPAARPPKRTAAVSARIRAE